MSERRTWASGTSRKTTPHIFWQEEDAEVIFTQEPRRMRKPIFGKAAAATDKDASLPAPRQETEQIMHGFDRAHGSPLGAAPQGQARDNSWQLALAADSQWGQPTASANPRIRTSAPITRPTTDHRLNLATLAAVNGRSQQTVSSSRLPPSQPLNE